MLLQSSDADRLQRRIGHEFVDGSLLFEALTHSTFAYEHRHLQKASNERLEFLGDAVLDLAVGDALFRMPARNDEGSMSKSRSLIVCENTLAELAVKLELGVLLLLGKGEESTGGRDKASNLSNAMEAVFGAVYLDAGFDKACQVIQNLLKQEIAEAASGTILHDHKSRLLELSQASPDKGKIKFVILSEQGPVHDRIFIAGVLLNEIEISQGTGSSKKEAEQQAAREAIRYFKTL